MDLEDFNTARRRLKELGTVMEEPELRAGLEAVLSLKDAHRDMIQASDMKQAALQAAMNEFAQAKISLANEQFHVSWLEQVIRQCNAEDLEQFKLASADWEDMKPYPESLRQLRGELLAREKLEDQLKTQNERNFEELKTLDAQKRLPKTTIDVLSNVENSLENLKRQYDEEIKKR
jgi:hypothetical protein